MLNETFKTIKAKVSSYLVYARTLILVLSLINLTQFLVACSAHQNPIPSFRGTNYSQNLPSRFSQNHKVQIVRNNPPAEIKKPKETAESLTEKENNEELNYLIPEDILNPDFSLAVLYKNVCLSKKASDAPPIPEIAEILFIDTANRNMTMEVQVYHAKVIKEVTVKQLNEALKKDPCVIGLTQNNQFKQMQFDDPLFKKQAHHRILKTSSAYDSYFRNLSINSPSVKIAIVDSGIDVLHPDLKQHIWKNPQGQDVINFSNQGNSFDKAGHGTHVAGIIGAQANNKAGVVGVLNSGDYELMAIKVVNQLGHSDAVSIVNGALYAIENNADVINLSLGSDGFNDFFIEVIRKAYFKKIPIVVSAGNEGKDLKKFENNIAGFGDTPGVIIVGSVDAKSMKRSPFSNYGPMIDIYAPGAIDSGDKTRDPSCILSTLPTTFNYLGVGSMEISDDENGTDYGYSCGTSMAAPMVTGAVALMIKYFKANKIPYTAQYLENLLKYSLNKKLDNANLPENKLVLDLEKLAWTLDHLKEINLEDSSMNFKTPTKQYLEETYINYYLELSKNDGSMKALSANLDHKDISLFDLNLNFVQSRQYKEMPTAVADIRIANNIIGYSLSTDDRNLYIESIPKNNKDDKFLNEYYANAIGSLLLTHESIDNLQKRGFFGYPVFMQDIGKSTDEIKSLYYKRVKMVDEFRLKNNRSPDFQEVQQIISDSDAFWGLEVNSDIW